MRRERVFNNSWEKITRISARPTKSIGKGALVKTEEHKIHKLTNAQIDAHNQNHGYPVSRAYVEKHARAKNGLYLK